MQLLTQCRRCKTTSPVFMRQERDGPVPCPPDGWKQVNLCPYSKGLSPVNLQETWLLCKPCSEVVGRALRGES